MLSFDRTWSAWLDGLTDERPFWGGLATFCARWLLLLFFGAAVLALTRYAEFGPLTAILLIFTLGLAYLLTLAIAYAVRRKRPYEVSADAAHIKPWIYTPSFPSSHAMAAFVIATILVFEFPLPLWGIICLYLVSTIIAISRVVVGVHYLTDVIAGALVGLSINALIIWSNQVQHFIGKLLGL